MKLIDIHCHFESPRFKDLDRVVADAKKVGVKYIIQSGTSPKNNRKALELSKKYPEVLVSFGMYPVGNLSKDLGKEISWIEEHKNSCVAIGEIGMDFNNHQRKRHHEKQQVLFEKMILLAKKINRPVVIHSRKAEKECIEVLENHQMKNVIMHCFHGNKKLIKRCIENGWSFSIPPNITRLKHFEMLVGMAPLEQLLTETDAPYLAPVAGEVNEPKNVAITVKKIAEIKGISEEEVAGQVWKNAVKMFKLNP